MTGRAEHAVVLQAASLLLQYPDDRLREALPTIRAAVTQLPQGSPRDRLLAFIRHLENTAWPELQEHYVAVLDRRRRCCLYLTWWTDGETRRRGLSLARLKGIYRDHGMHLHGGELPDYLPVVLEFAATADLTVGLELLQEHRAGLELLRLALTDLATPYAAPVQAVCALLPGPSPADAAAARALAHRGPPTENVGLEPYGVTTGGQQ
jgi:nitrate reductase delta subunit